MVLILLNVVLVKGQLKAPFSKCTNGVLWYMQHLFWDVLQHGDSKWAYLYLLMKMRVESGPAPVCCGLTRKQLNTTHLSAHFLLTVGYRRQSEKKKKAKLMD